MLSSSGELELCPPWSRIWWHCHDNQTGIPSAPIYTHDIHKTDTIQSNYTYLLALSITMSAALPTSSDPRWPERPREAAALMVAAAKASCIVMCSSTQARCITMGYSIEQQICMHTEQLCFLFCWPLPVYWAHHGVAISIGVEVTS